jgi:hypothetical protein
VRAGGLISENADRHLAHHRDKVEKQGEDDPRAVFGPGVNAQCFGHGGAAMKPVQLVCSGSPRSQFFLAQALELSRNFGKGGNLQAGIGPVGAIPQHMV